MSKSGLIATKVKKTVETILLYHSEVLKDKKGTKRNAKILAIAKKYDCNPITVCEILKDVSYCNIYKTTQYLKLKNEKNKKNRNKKG